MRGLILTDHSTHTHHNSLYVLTNSFVEKDPETEWYIASRGSADNQDFFRGAINAPVHAFQIKEPVLTVDNIHDFVCNNVDIFNGTPDYLFLRLPHPVPEEFLMMIKKRYSPAVIINDPEGILKTTSKDFLLNFKNLGPFITATDDYKEIKALSKKKDLVLKPLKNYGGKGIIRIKGGKAEMGKKELTERELQNLLHNKYLIMEYLPRVTEGDKRIVVIDGEILGASLRKPPAGGWLCNVAGGGSATPMGVTANEKKIVSAVAGSLDNLGIIMYGIDTLMGKSGERVLSEINTMSIGGLNDIKSEDFPNPVERAVDKLLQYFKLAD